MQAVETDGISILMFFTVYADKKADKLRRNFCFSMQHLTYNVGPKAPHSSFDDDQLM